MFLCSDLCVIICVLLSLFGELVHATMTTRSVLPWKSEIASSALVQGDGHHSSGSMGFWCPCQHLRHRYFPRNHYSPLCFLLPPPKPLHPLLNSEHSALIQHGIENGSPCFTLFFHFFNNSLYFHRRQCNWIHKFPFGFLCNTIW